MALDDTRKPVSTLNGLRAAAFFSTFALTVGLVGGGALLGNAVAFSFPYRIASMVLAGYITRDLFGVGSTDALFASDAVIRAKRAARRA
jgi:hypothetical protein